MQAYLEAEPATRTIKDEYVMRYQRFAKSGLEQALKKYTTLHTNIGKTALMIVASVRRYLSHSVTLQSLP